VPGVIKHTALNNAAQSGPKFTLS